MPVATLPEQDALTQPLDIQEGDRLHFLGDGTVEVVRDKKRLWLVKSDYIPSVSLRKRAAPGEAKQLETQKGAGSESKEHPPIPAGARWISIHPGGNSDATAIPLLIMPHEDGSASVLGGAGGKLNLLKLDSLKSPEQWKESAQKRATEKKKKEKERVEGQSDEEKEKEKKAKDEVAEFKQTATHENALKTLEAFEKNGVDIGLSTEHKLALQTPPDPGTEPEKVEEWQRLTREASQKVKAIHQAYEKKLVTDHDARAAAQLGDADLDTNNRLIENSAHTAAAPDGSTMSEIIQLPGGSWLVKGDEAKQFDNWKDAAKQHLRNVLEGEQSVGGDRTQGDSFYSPSNWVKDVKDEQLPEGFQFKPEVALEIARLSAERKAADKQALTAEDAIKKRSILEGGGIDLGPVREITQREVLDKLEAQAKTLKDASINGNFLKVIDDVGDADKLKKHHSTGGWSAIAEVASEVFKQTPISRELVDLLGHNEAGKVLANMMALNLSDDDYEATKEAIAAYHAKQSTLHAKGAVKQVGKIQERLASLHEEMIGLAEFSEGVLDPVQQIQMDSMLYEAQTLNDSIQQILGTRLGQLQATAAVIAAMEAKPKTLRFSGEAAKKLMEHVPGLYGGETENPAAGDDPEEGRLGDGAEDARPSVFEAYGLTAEDFKVFPGPDGDVIQVNPSGLNKLSVGYNPEDQEAYERAVAIKRGDFDEEDFVPAGFSHYQPITEYQPADLANGYGVKLDVNEAMSDDEMTGKIRDYFGAVVANGISPADARDGIYNRDFARSMGIDPDSELGDRIYKNVGNFILDIAEVQDEKLGRRVSVPKMISALEELSQQHQEKQWQSGEGVNGKGLQRDVATEAAHRTLADMPVARLALKQWEDLSGKEKQQIRDYAIEHVWKPSRGDNTDGFVKVESLSGAEEVARALALPGKDGETKSVGGQNYAYHKGEGRWLTQQDYDGKRKAEEEAANTEQGGLFDFGDFGSDEPAAAPSQSLAEQQEQQELESTDEYWDGIKDTDDPWTQFSKLMGGGDRASKVALEHLRGQFNSRFAHAYSQLAGEPAPMVSTTHSHYQNLMTAKLPETQRKKLLKWQRDRDQSDAAKIRQRSGGKFVKEDDDWYDQYQQLKGGALQGSLGVGDEEGAPTPRSSGGSYTALGKQAQLDMNSVLEKVLPNFDQISAPKVGIINRVNWSKGTQHDMKQRVLKLLEAQKKIGLHAGAGCVHGSTLLRCEKTGVEQSFYDWWVRGDRPFVKALDDCPEVVVVTQASPVFIKGLEPMHEVELESGDRITVTMNHRFLHLLHVDKLEIPKWEKLVNLQVGDRVAIAAGSFSPIVKVERIPGDEHLVFDITVPTYANYLAHGIFNHNSGKSATMLGAFSHLHAQGKVRKLITCLPSSIVGQFVGEAVTFLEPGKFNYAANLGWDREQRLAALRDPNMHVYMTTRESMTNDLMHLVEKHTGIDSETFREKPEAEQHELLLKGCKAEGIETEGLLLAVDEAHDISSRKGVKASKRSLALKGLAQHSSYYIEATGDPTKNSASEAYSFLHAVDPAKFNDLNKFMAEYGQDSSASKRSLQRAIAPYSFAFSTKPQSKGENGVSGRTLKMNINQPTIKASERVAKERQRILDDVGLISAWQTQRREQLKEQHGEGYQPTTEDFNTAWDNETVRGAIDRLGSDNTWHALDDNGKKTAIGGQIRAMGGLKRTAMFRLVHLTPYEDNPKMQWTVNHAVEQHKAGKPGIIFSSSSEACGMMKEQLEKQGLKVAYIHGGLDGSGKDAQRIMFQDSGEADVLIATDAARTGVNLTRGKYVTHYDVPLTEMGFAQRSARSYRLKQTEDVDIHVPMLDMPEEKMALARMERKGKEGKVFKTSSENIDQTGMARKIREARAMKQAA